ncbi:NLR family CARD domain-containing protein 4-like [Amphiura filiformis]|uniref:NLR family CARD domain-containing protein 4-like n=1 Tax=Amphiura filiformis TaxID=82378 RepID=UPI003B2255C8
MTKAGNNGTAQQNRCSKDKTIPISDKMPIKELKRLASEWQVDITECLEKSDLVAVLRNAQQKNQQSMSTKVDQIDESTQQIQAGVDEIKTNTDKIQVVSDATKETQKDVRSISESTKRMEEQLFELKDRMTELKAGDNAAAQQHSGSAVKTVPITDKMSIKELKGLASELQVDITGCLEKSELVAALRNAQQQNTQNNSSGGQTNLEEQTDTSGGTRKVQSRSAQANTEKFNLQECQEELKEFYLSEKGKVNLLPWVPDAVEDMDNIFVDLELVKQQSFRSSGEEVVKLESNEDLVSLKTDQGQRVNRVLVMGDAGSGKSTMAANIAYKWAGLKDDSQSPLSKFTLVFLISLHEIQDSNDNLVDLIFQLILPEDSQVSKEGLKSYITSNATDVLLLIDGMDEDSSGILKARSNEITKILHNRKLRSCCVILTTRPHRIGDLGEHLRHYTQVKLRGFSLENILKYIDKFFREDTDKNNSLIQKLQDEPHILALAAIPVLLLMICLLWEDQCSLPSTKTQLYKNTLNHMWKRYKSKESQNFPSDEESDSDDEEMTDEMKSLVYTLGKIVLNGIYHGNEQVVFSEKDFGSKVCNLGCQVGIITRERLRSKCKVKALVIFLHKSFQDLCAGMYLAKLFDSSRTDFDICLKKLYGIDQNGFIHFYSTYVLDFCCGFQPHLPYILLKLTLSLSKEHKISSHESFLDISSHLSHIFESQLTYAELVSLFSCESTNIGLSISSTDIPYVLYLLKLTESAKRHEGFILTRLAYFQIKMEYKQWIPSLLNALPNLVRLAIHLGLSNTPSQLNELYFAINKLTKLKDLTLQNFNALIRYDITYLLDILTKNKQINLNELFLSGFQFDNKVNANYLTTCTSLTYLSLYGPLPQIPQRQLTAIKDVIKVIPNLRKLESLNIVHYQICGAVKYLKPVVSQLLRLNLRICLLSERHLKELFTFLNRAQKLKLLDLSCNRFSLSSVKSLVECLQQIPSLEELSLLGTGLNDETVCVLARGLKEMKSPLLKLILDINSFSQIGKAALEGLPVEDDVMSQQLLAGL